MKSWNLILIIIYNIVFNITYFMFILTITWTWHDTNCHCLTAWHDLHHVINLNWMQKIMKKCCLKTTSMLYVMRLNSLAAWNLDRTLSSYLDHDQDWSHKYNSTMWISEAFSKTAYKIIENILVDFTVFY